MKVEPVTLEGQHVRHAFEVLSCIRAELKTDVLNERSRAANPLVCHVGHGRAEGTAMIVQIVRFQSGLDPEEVQRKYEARAPLYRALPGLIQKYYPRYPATSEHGAVYLWESEEALEEFRRSDLGRTIADTYQVQGTPETRVGAVVLTLRPEAEPARR
jgi:heme-degrading monooxygenase HmoA